MEEKESTVSGSPGCGGGGGGGGGGGSYTDSPPPVSSNVVLPQTQPPPPPAGGGVELFGKKKRGRPRKYDSEGNLRLSAYSSSAAGIININNNNNDDHCTVFSSTSSPPGFSLTPSPEFASAKRGRGRPAGSGNWQLLASLGELFLNTAGGDFTPHVVTVNTGEDVAGKILSLSHKGPRGICILSANGAVSNVTIRQPGSSGGILTYEGRFEILSLSGSFTINDAAGGVRSRTGGLSVSLAGPDGRVIGGGVAGLLLAASPIQLVVGSFMPNGYKLHKKKHTTPSMSPTAQDPVMAARPISQANPEEINSTPITQLPIPSHGEPDNVAREEQVVNVKSAGWNVSETTSYHGLSPDINVSLASE